MYPEAPLTSRLLRCLAFLLAHNKLFLWLSFQMEKEQRGDTENAPPPSPSTPPKIILKRDQPLAYTATEDTFKDTANLVKEDSVV